MNGLDLFSGIGGISLALEPWVKTVAYCEADRYAQGVLLSRMRDGNLDRAPIWDDVRTLRGDMLPRIDVICGGFPCQDISAAGKGGGLSGERSGLFFEIMRLVDECRPAFVFLENVPAIRTRGLEVVAQAFTDRGFDFSWFVLSAEKLGAPHVRNRWWGLASDPHGRKVRLRSKRRPEGRAGTVRSKGQAELVDDGGKEFMADPDREGKLCKAENGSEVGDGACDRGDPFGGNWWATEPNVGRVAHGISSRMDRIRCLGNSVVPIVAREAWLELMRTHGFRLEKIAERPRLKT